MATYMVVFKGRDNETCIHLTSGKSPDDAVADAEAKFPVVRDPEVYTVQRCNMETL